MARSRSPPPHQQDSSEIKVDQEKTRIYVGNLSYQVRDDDLLDYFSKSKTPFSSHSPFLNVTLKPAPGPGGHVR